MHLKEKSGYQMVIEVGSVLLTSQLSEYRTTEVGDVSFPGLSFLVALTV
jgi:hypothetical protein